MRSVRRSCAKHPNATFDEYHHEREFLVDRRRRETVTVAQRFTGTPAADLC
jgi:hypothetical protein